MCVTNNEMTTVVLTREMLTQNGIDDRWDFLYRVCTTTHAVNILKAERSKYYEDTNHVGIYSLQFLLGVIYDLQGNERLADKHYRLAILADDNDDHARVNLYLLLSKTDNVNDINEGLVMLKIAAERKFARAVHHVIKRQLLIDIAAGNGTVNSITVANSLDLLRYATDHGFHRSYYYRSVLFFQSGDYYYAMRELATAIIKGGCSLDYMLFVRYFNHVPQPFSVTTHIKQCCENAIQYCKQHPTTNNVDHQIVYDIINYHTSPYILSLTQSPPQQSSSLSSLSSSPSQIQIQTSLSSHSSAVSLRSSLTGSRNGNSSGNSNNCDDVIDECVALLPDDQILELIPKLEQACKYQLVIKYLLRCGRGDGSNNNNVNEMRLASVYEKVGDHDNKVKQLISIVTCGINDNNVNVKFAIKKLVHHYATVNDTVNLGKYIILLSESELTTIITKFERDGHYQQAINCLLLLGENEGENEVNISRLMRLASLYGEVGNKQQQVQYWMLAADRGDHESVLNLCDYYHNRDDEHEDEGFKYYQMAIDLGYVEGHFYLGYISDDNIEFKTTCYQYVVDNCDKLLTKYKDFYASALYNIGSMYGKLNEYELSCKYYIMYFNSVLYPRCDVDDSDIIGVFGGFNDVVNKSYYVNKIIASLKCGDELKHKIMNTLHNYYFTLNTTQYILDSIQLPIHNDKKQQLRQQLIHITNWKYFVISYLKDKKYERITNIGDTSDIINDNDNICPVCMDTFIVYDSDDNTQQRVVLPCLHSICSSCLDVYLDNFNSCPLCKSVFC